MMMRSLTILACLALVAGCDRIDPRPQPEQEPPPAPDPVDPAEPEQDPGPETPGSDPVPGDPLQDAEGRTFTYRPAGDLIPGSAPPHILVDETVYDDAIVFPAEDAVFLNSQQYGHGGYYAHVNGKGPDQCDAENFNYPWRDNFCEKRSKNQYFCQSGGHTGVDIRPATCAKSVHWVVAPEAGVIYHIGSYGVQLMADDGTWYQFLHMDMDNLAVSVGQDVAPGQRIGRFSNVYYDSNGNPAATTIHMHLDMKESYAPSNGDAPFLDRVNPYMTLVAAYQRKLAGL